MQPGYILCFFILPIFLEGCCVGNRQTKRTETRLSPGLQRDAQHWHYRVVEGEICMMPCIDHLNHEMAMVWSRTGEDEEGNEGTSVVCGKEFLAEAKHSGKYTFRCLLSSGSDLLFHLQVVERISLGLGCIQPEESSIDLVVDKGGQISCPGLNCHNNTDVIWYKGMKAVSDQNRSSCQKTGRLYLCQVYKLDTGVYFCDSLITEQGVTWTFRRAVNVTVIPDKASYSPRIIYPDGNTTEEVELGRSHTLICKVYFPYERTQWKVSWYMSYDGTMENMTLLPMEEQEAVRVIFKEYEVVGRAIIKGVTPQHLSLRYTCLASNTVASSSVTIQLKEKIKVKWPSLIGYPFAPLLLVAGLGIILHVKWLEIQLIYRSHFQHGRKNGDEKEFDVFLSYVWSPPSAQVEGVLTLTSQTEPDADEEVGLSSMEPLNSEEDKPTQRALEVVLPQVLEDQWGYRLCLLERDVLPGGAFTNDVVLAIQRSQMLLCLLSADYLSDSNAVFVLESGVQALLQNSALKLLLIWTSRASASLIQTDPPLPTLVQRALKVLPSLDWTSGKPARDSRFWRTLRRAMPDHRVKLVSLTQDQ